MIRGKKYINRVKTFPMNKTIHLFAFLLIFAISLKCRSQSFITIDGSQTFSNFRFTDSQGKKDKNYSVVASGGYSLGYRMCKKGFFVRFNLGMRKAGATAAFDNGTISWNLQYCDLRLGAGYELDKWRIKPYVSAAPYLSFLLSANQSLNGLNYDIKRTKSIKNSDAGVLIIPGVRAMISDYFSIYTEFSYLIGLQNLETTSHQTWKNTGYLFTLGIAATLTKSKPKWL